jgi:hypothetical protein
MSVKLGSPTNFYYEKVNTFINVFIKKPLKPGSYWSILLSDNGGTRGVHFMGLFVVISRSQWSRVLKHEPSSSA